MFVACHAELQSWCNADTNHVGFITLNGQIYLNTTSTAQCGMYVAEISVDACAVTNIIYIPVDGSVTLDMLLLNTLMEMSSNSVVGLVTTCGLTETGELRQVLRQYRVPLPNRNFDIKLEAVIYIGASRSAKSKWAPCGKRESQLCVDIARNPGKPFLKARLVLNKLTTLDSLYIT